MFWSQFWWSTAPFLNRCKRDSRDARSSRLNSQGDIVILPVLTRNAIARNQRRVCLSVGSTEYEYTTGILLVYWLAYLHGSRRVAACLLVCTACSKTKMKGHIRRQVVVVALSPCLQGHYNWKCVTFFWTSMTTIISISISVPMLVLEWFLERGVQFFFKVVEQSKQSVCRLRSEEGSIILVSSPKPHTWVEVHATVRFHCCYSSWYSMPRRAITWSGLILPPPWKYRSIEHRNVCITVGKLVSPFDGRYS